MTKSRSKSKDIILDNRFDLQVTFLILSVIIISFYISIMAIQSKSYIMKINTFL